jgi:anti-sigma B factor antagonist
LQDVEQAHVVSSTKDILRRESQPTLFALALEGPKAIMDEPTNQHIGAWEVAVPLEITQREMNGIYLLALRGRLVLGDESSGFRATVENLLASGATRIVVNLEHVTHVDSAGLGSLIEAHRKTKAQGGRLKLSNLGPKFKQALELARLLPIFETSPTEGAALAGF